MGASREYFGAGALASGSIAMKTFKSQSIYPISIFANLISGALNFVVPISLWIALYKNGQDVNGTISEAMTFSILNTFIIGVMFLRVSRDLSDFIYSGDIETYMLLPVDFINVITSAAFGRTIFKLITFSLPIVLISVVLLDVIIPPSLLLLCCALIALVLGQIIYLQLQCLLGYTAFWLQANWYVVWVEVAVMTIFGGSKIPVWFYPAWLHRLSEVLPFCYTGYKAIEIWTGRADIGATAVIVAVQVLWILLLHIAGVTVKTMALKKLTINGG